MVELGSARYIHIAGNWHLCAQFRSLNIKEHMSNLETQLRYLSHKDNKLYVKSDEYINNYNALLRL